MIMKYLKWVARVLGFFALFYYINYFFRPVFPDLLENSSINSLEILIPIIICFSIAIIGHILSWFENISGDLYGGWTLVITGFIILAIFIIRSNLEYFIGGMTYSMFSLIPGLIFLVESDKNKLADDEMDELEEY